MGKPAKSVIARNTKLKTSMADLSRDASMTEAKMAAFNEIMLSGLWMRRNISQDFVIKKKII